ERPEVPQALRSVGRSGLHPSHRGADRGHFLPLASDQPLGPSVRQHPCRPHHPQGLHRLCGHDDRWSRCPGLGRCHPADDHGRRPDRPRVSRRYHPGLCVRTADLHVSQRRDPPVPLTTNLGGWPAGPKSLERTTKWKLKPRSSSVPVLLVSVWLAPPLAWPTSSATSCRVPCATRRLPRASSVT